MSCLQKNWFKTQTSLIAPSIIDAHQEQYHNEKRECHICKKKFGGKNYSNHMHEVHQQKFKKGCE